MHTAFWRRDRFSLRNRTDVLQRGFLTAGENLYLVIFVLVFGIYFAVVIQMYQDGRFDGADATSLLGKSILLRSLAPSSSTSS